MQPATRSALIGGAVMTVIAATFALGRGPVPVHQLRDKPFQHAFGEDMATLVAASERIEELNRPRVVQTESIKPVVEPDPPARIAVLQTVGATASARRKVSRDICAKHNMRKVYYGSTWRCRK